VDTAKKETIKKIGKEGVSIAVGVGSVSFMEHESTKLRRDDLLYLQWRDLVQSVQPVPSLLFSLQPNCLVSLRSRV
jgi:hypothetical protein